MPCSALPPLYQPKPSHIRPYRAPTAARERQRDPFSLQTQSLSPSYPISGHDPYVRTIRVPLSMGCAGLALSSEKKAPEPQKPSISGVHWMPFIARGRRVLVATAAREYRGREIWTLLHCVARHITFLGPSARAGTANTASSPRGTFLVWTGRPWLSS